MAEKYSRSVLRVVAAQLTQAVGFDSIQSSSLDILTNVVERYLQVLGKSVHDFTEKCGQTQPNLNDVEYALRQLHVSIPDMIEYMQQMEPVPFAQKVTKFPAQKLSNLQFPSGYNMEDFDRGEHIPLYMPSMIIASKSTTEKAEGNVVPPPENQTRKAGTFVIAGKQDSSSDEDDYSAGEASNEEYASDDSLSHNPIKSRHLTKPEDIPMIEGTAPSSMFSVPSSADLDELRGSTSPARCINADDFLNTNFDNRAKKGKKLMHTARRQSQVEDNDVPWLNAEKFNPVQLSRLETTSTRPDSGSSQILGKTQPEEPNWLSKKSKDEYDADWLQERAASPIHLTKPPTPDGSFESPMNKKKSWDNDTSDLPSLGSVTTSIKKGSTKKDYSTLSEVKSKNPFSALKHLSKSLSDRKHHKLQKPVYKKSPLGKRTDTSDVPIKAKIEAAEKLLHSPPNFRPSSPKSSSLKTPHKPLSKSPLRTSIANADKLLKHPPVDNLSFHSSRESSPATLKLERSGDRKKEEKQERSGQFASSKSMYDAIDAVINRASNEVVSKDEEDRKKEDDEDLMKFQHLVKDSSSSDSEQDVSHKAEQMLQLEERGLREARPSTPGLSPMQPPTPSSANTPQSFVIDEEDEVDVVDDSEEETSIPLILPPKKKIYEESTPKSSSGKYSKKEKHKKDKSRKSEPESEIRSSHKSHSGSRSKKDKHSLKSMPSSVTTETILEKPVKMKVKLKKNFIPNEPKLFDVDRDRDRIRISESKHSSKTIKEERHKSKEDKLKSKEHRKHHTSKLSDHSQSPATDHDLSVKKIILKKSKSGEAEVVRPKVKEHTRSPSPPSPERSRNNLPVPKLSAAVPVMNITPSFKEKDKKKSKKEKKKKREKERSYEKEKHHEKERSESKESSYERERWDDKSAKRKASKDADLSSPMVPKLTLKMGTDEKKFIIKPSGLGGKSTGKKRSHSSQGESPIRPKERKVSIETSKKDIETAKAAVERKVITQTISAGPVGVYEDEEGNKVWICPGCNKPDDGSPMVGCDTCDDWYHWPCVKITEEPEDDNWYCPRCLKRQQQEAKGKSSTKKRKKK